MATPCTPSGVLGLGDCPAALRLCVRPGAILVKDVALQDPITGDPVDWAADMTAWLEIRSGSFDEQYPAVVDGSLLRFSIPGTETLKWPKGASAAIWLQYIDLPGPIVWVEGHIERGCC